MKAKIKIKKRTMQSLVKRINQENILDTYAHDRFIILNFDFCHNSIAILLINKKRKEKVRFALSNNKDTFLFLEKLNNLKNRKLSFLVKGKLKKFVKHQIYKTIFNK